MNRTVRPLAAILALLASSACSMPEAPARTALVFGVADYEGTGHDLTYTDDDANSVTTMLTANGWSVTKGLDGNADAGDIANAITGLAGIEGIVLFYFSGHGGLVNGESAIVPYGTIGNESGWITASELTAMFKAAGLENVVIILDSCYSGGFVEDGATVDAIPDVFGDNDSGGITYTWFVDATGDAIRGYMGYEGDSGYVVISAAGAGESSYESDVYGHGIFTYALLQGANSREADLNVDGYATTSELYAYCAAFIDRYWNSVSSDDYMPHLSGTAREYALWAVD